MVTLWEGILQLLVYICIADLPSCGGFLQAGARQHCLTGRDGALYWVGEGAALIDLQHLVPAHTLAPDRFRNVVVLKLGNKLSLKIGKAPRQGNQPQTNGLGTWHATQVSKFCPCSNIEPKNLLLF